MFFDKRDRSRLRCMSRNHHNSELQTWFQNQARHEAENLKTDLNLDPLLPD